MFQYIFFITEYIHAEKSGSITHSVLMQDSRFEKESLIYLERKNKMSGVIVVQMKGRGEGRAAMTAGSDT